MKSLRLRLTVYAGLIVIGAIFLTGIGLTYQFQRHIERRVGQELNAHLEQIIGGLRFDDIGNPSLARQLSDPRFGRIFGGLYYQVISEGTGDIALKSRSLWDTRLDLPDDVLDVGGLHVHTHPGPNNSTLLIHERIVTFPERLENTELRISVGIDRKEILELSKGFTNDLFLALGLLGAVLLAGFAFQISAGMRPMDGLRRDVANIRSGQTKRMVAPVPSEVAPLVEEVNGLLDLQDQSMIRARDRAADMAHGLKTPLTALASDIARLRAKGETEIANDIEDLGNRMRRHLDRELARARQRHGSDAPATDSHKAINAIIRTLTRTPMGEVIAFSNNAPEGILLPIGLDDFNDVVGNLLENACRFAKARVSVTVTQDNGLARISVADDGPGLSPEQIESVSKRGARIDMSGQGAGLGLSIVGDILESYGGKLTFQKNEPTGLIVIAEIPDAHNAL